MTLWLTIEVWGLQNHCLKSEHLNLALLVASIFPDSIFFFFNKVISGLWAATYNKKQSVWNTGECK